MLFVFIFVCFVCKILLLAQASFACAFLIYTNIYFQHKRGRLRYLTEAKQTQEALLAMSQLEHEVGDFGGLNQR